MTQNSRTLIGLIVLAFMMLGLGFASKPLYEKFCQVTGFGGTPRSADANNSEIIDRTVRVFFDANISPELGWEFKPEQRYMDVKLGQSGLAYYSVKNVTDEPLVGTATFNVTPIKAAPYFIKTECFCFQEQLVEPGQEISMPVLFFVEQLLNDEARLNDVRDITLSYTFFPVENPTDVKFKEANAAQSRDEALN